MTPDPLVSGILWGIGALGVAVLLGMAVLALGSWWDR